MESEVRGRYGIWHLNSLMVVIRVMNGLIFGALDVFFTNFVQKTTFHLVDPMKAYSSKKLDSHVIQECLHTLIKTLMIYMKFA